MAGRLAYDGGGLGDMLGHAWGTLRAHAALAAALALFNGWIYIFFWSGSVGAGQVEGTAGLGSPVFAGVWLPSLVVCTLVLLTLFAVPRLCGRVGRTALCVAAACLVASVALVALSGMSGMSHAGVLRLAGGALSGVGTGLCTAYLGRVVTRYDASVVLVFVSVALLFSALCCAAFSLVPVPAVWGALVAIPFAFLASCLRCGIDVPPRPASARPPESATDACDDPAARPTDPARSLPRLPARLTLFLGLVFVIGLSGGMLRSLSDGELGEGGGALVVALAMATASLMLFFSRVPEDGNPFTLFYRAVALVAAAFVILTLVARNAPLVLGIHTAGYTYSFGLLWVFCVIFAQHGDDPARIFVSGFLVRQVGEAVGALVMASALRIEGADGGVALVANIMIYVLLFAVIILLARLSAHPGPHDAPRERRHVAPSIEEAVRQAGVCFGLTERETQILEGLVRGYDRTYVARKLDVSPETVKTHVTHIYRKLEVHTRVELYAAVMTPGDE